ncbi:unnamed protein product [Amoebophrya sp. A120]|nr:unnamed protein product [Amoebophrya sp. A120]|eukprot:GSA120T00022058001.1
MFYSLTPFFGSTYGGTEVSIKGQNLLPDDEQDATVKCIFWFGRPVEAISVNQTVITCVTNAALNPTQSWSQEVQVQYLNRFLRVYPSEAQLDPRPYNVSTFTEGFEEPMMLSTGLKFNFEPPPEINTIEPLVVAQHDYILVAGKNFLRAGVKTHMRCRYRLKLDNLNTTAEQARVLRMNNEVSETKVLANIINSGVKPF